MSPLLNRRALLASMAAGGLLVAAPAFAAGDDPISFARALYALPYLWTDATADDAIDRYLAPDLAALIRTNYAKDDIESALDYDPLIQAQEADEIKPVFKLESRAGKDASVRASFDNFGEPTTVVLDLLQTADGWRLADIRTDDGGSLALELTELNAAGK